MRLNTRWPSLRKAIFKKRRNCDICGLPWPEDMLHKQRGLLVCPEDYDDLSHEDYVRMGTTPIEPKPRPWEGDPE